MKTYQEKIQELQEEQGQLEHALGTCTPDRHGQLTARLASVRRSLRWYQRRLPRRIGVLSVGVFDSISAAERVS